MSDRLLVSLLIAGVMLVPRPGLMAEELGVSVRRCTWLDTEALDRLTKLELAAEDTGGLALEYACGGDDVTIGISNAAKGIRVERRITGACCDDAEPERTLALLSVGLLQAARALLGATGDGEAGTVVLPPVSAKGEPVDALPAPPPDPFAPDATAASDVLSPAPAVTTPWVPTYPPPMPVMEAPGRQDDGDRIHQLGLAARTRFYNLEDAVPTFGVGAHYRAWPWSRFGVGAAFDASFGSVARDGGEVDTRLLSLSALVATRFATWAPLSLLAELRGGATLVTIEGSVPDNADVRFTYVADSVTGGTGHLVFSLIPVLRSDYAELALPIEIGGLFRAPRGAVDDGRTVQVDGFWLGGGLSFSLGWQRRAPERAVGGIR